MSVPLLSDEARIAIAFCALKFKPQGQSFRSYVLDLRSKFPSESYTSPGNVAWRERILGLERDLGYLQMKYNKERISKRMIGIATNSGILSYRAETLCLQTSEVVGHPVAFTSTIPAKKLKQQSHLNPVIDLEEVLSGMNHDAIPAMPQSVFSSFDTLKNLAELSNDEKTLPTTLLTAATSRALEDLGALLRTLLLPKLSSSTSIEMLRTVGTFLSYLLTTALPLFVSRLKGTLKAAVQDSLIIMALDEIFGRLTTLIFIPLTRSLGPLSEAYMVETFSSNHVEGGGIPSTFDIRSGLCSLVRKAMSDLDLLGALATASLVHIIRGVRERVSLETVREMERFFLPQDDAARTTPDEAASTHTPKTRIPRIHKLARKDTLWYLCSILHIVFIPSSASSAGRPTPKASYDRYSCVSAANKLLEDAVLTGFSRIIGRCPVGRCCTFSSHNKNSEINNCHVEDSIWDDIGNGKLSGKCSCRITVDEVGHGMILAVAERAWLHLFGHGTDDTPQHGSDTTGMGNAS